MCWPIGIREVAVTYPLRTSTEEGFLLLQLELMINEAEEK